MSIQPLKNIGIIDAFKQLTAQASAPRKRDGSLNITHRWHLYLAQNSVLQYIQQLDGEVWNELPAVTLSIFSDSHQIESGFIGVCGNLGIRAEQCEVVVHLTSNVFYSVAKSNKELPSSDVPRSEMLRVTPRQVLKEDIKAFEATNTWIDTPFVETPIALRCDKSVYGAISAALTRVSKSGLFALQVVASPLEMAAVIYLTQGLESSSGGHVAWIYYDQFSVLMSFGAGGEPLTFRRVDHVSNILPSQICTDINQVVLGSNLAKPNLSIFKCSSIPTEQAVSFLEQSCGHTAPLFNDDSIYTQNGTKEFFAQMPDLAKGSYNEIPYEMLCWMKKLWSPQSKIFKNKCLGNFFSLPIDIKDAIAPVSLTRKSQLLALSCVLAWLLSIACALFVVFVVYSSIKSEDWKGSSVTAAKVKNDLEAKNIELQELERIESNLILRSSPTFVLAFTRKIFDIDSGVELDKINYSFKPSAVSAKSAAKQVGFERVMAYQGRVDDKKKDQLRQLGDETVIKKEMESVAAKTDFSSFKPLPSHNVKVNLNLNESSAGKTSFELTISESIPESSPLALGVR